MKAVFFLSLSLLAPLAAAHAGSRSSASYRILADTADAGGSRAISANYSNAGSASLIAGVSSVAAPVETAKSGYIAQLYELSGLLLNSAAPDVNETATLQLAAWQLLDDATLLATDANAVTWGIVSGPLTDISASGLVTAGFVYQNTAASVQGSYLGNTGTLPLTVRNVNADDFGSYAGDGLDDAWQNQYFGLNNPNAAPAFDPDGDGQTNAFEFTAGLVPTDPQSRFTITIAPVPGQPAEKRLIFSPRLTDRTYAPQFRLSLTSGAWQPLSTITESDNGAERTVTDFDATGAMKFYRIEITRP